MVAGVILMIVLIFKSVQRAVTGVDGHYWFVVFYVAVAVLLGFRAYMVWKQLKPPQMRGKADKDKKRDKDG